jgi:threonine/homoserine/homoserine lactone efflux protein
LLERIKDDPRLFFIGGLILVVYGLITYFDKSNKKEAEDTPLIEIPVSNNYIKLLFKGFFLNFINIGVLGFWLGLIVVIGPVLKMNPNHIFWYFTTIVISYFVTDLGKIVLAKKLKKRLTTNVIYKIKKSMGIMLIIFGIGLILKGFIPQEKLNLDTFIEKVE